MAYVHKITIDNFRCFKHFETTLKDNLLCIIGRGDSGKTTLLDAISYILSPSYSIHFQDTDFHCGKVDNEIHIEAVLRDISDELVVKYGQYLIGVDDKGMIREDLEADDAEQFDTALRIVLTVDKSLEPEWNVTARGHVKSIRASDRALLGMSYINEYVDRHFSFSKGGFLYRSAKDSNELTNDKDILDILRGARNDINDHIKTEFTQTIDSVKQTATSLGFQNIDLKAYADSKDITFSEGNITLANEDIPLKRLGKGSRKLLSVAIQLANNKDKGIILVDEIELGLEPDRIIRLLRTLLQQSGVQIILTTHSATVLQELNYNQVALLHSTAEGLTHFSESEQGLLRGNPSAFFAKRILVCEGRTECAILRSLDSYMININLCNMATLGVVAIDGNGAEMINKAERLNSLGYKTALFCDNDVNDVNKRKGLIRGKTKIIECEQGLCFEDQLFKDASWDTIVEFINRKEEDLPGFKRKLYNEVKSSVEFDECWPSNVCQVEKDNILSIAKRKDKDTKGRVHDKSWFKNFEDGQLLGEILFSKISTHSENSVLLTNIHELINWIQNEQTEVLE